MNKFDKKLLDEYVNLTSISLEKHPTEDLFIYGYHSNLEESNIIWDDCNKHCRGLIIDSEGLDLFISFSHIENILMKTLYY